MSLTESILDKNQEISTSLWKFQLVSSHKSKKHVLFYCGVNEKINKWILFLIHSVMEFVSPEDKK